MSSYETRVKPFKVMDAIHGLIRAPEYCKAIIDTPEFQRMRSISQLGMAEYVYPTATHKRFSHCIGTMWIAHQWIKALQINCEARWSPSEREVRLVTTAALIHDLGHAAFSHMFEGVLEKHFGAGNFPDHEDLSGILFRELRSHSTYLQNTFSENDVFAIEKMVAGKKLYYEDQKYHLVPKGSQISDRKMRHYLTQIISNSFGPDADRLDYLCRDGHHLGFGMNTTLMQRFIIGSRISGGELTFSLHDSHSVALHFSERMFNFRIAYFHRTVVGLDQMMSDAIMALVRCKRLCLDCFHKDSVNCSEIITITDDHIKHLLWQIYVEGTPDVEDDDIRAAFDEAGSLFERLNRRHIYSNFESLLTSIKVKDSFTPEVLDSFVQTLDEPFKSSIFLKSFVSGFQSKGGSLFNKMKFHFKGKVRLLENPIPVAEDPRNVTILFYSKDPELMGTQESEKIVQEFFAYMNGISPEPLSFSQTRSGGIEFTQQIGMIRPAISNADASDEEYDPWGEAPSEVGSASTVQTRVIEGSSQRESDGASLMTPVAKKRRRGDPPTKRHRRKGGDLFDFGFEKKETKEEQSVIVIDG